MAATRAFWTPVSRDQPERRATILAEVIDPDQQEKVRVFLPNGDREGICVESLWCSWAFPGISLPSWMDTCSNCSLRRMWLPTAWLPTSGMKAQVTLPDESTRPAKVTDDSEGNLERRRQSMSTSCRPEISSSDEGCSFFHSVGPCLGREAPWNHGGAAPQSPVGKEMCATMGMCLSDLLLWAA